MVTTSAGVTHAFLYTGGQMQDLEPLLVPGASGQAAAINDAGQITGTQSGAFILSGGKMYNLGSLGGTITIPYGINASGQITGIATLDSPPGDGDVFLYTNGSLVDIGKNYGDGTGRSINDSGQITGTTAVAIGSQAFLYSGGVLKSLGTLGGFSSDGYGINNAGQITGNSFTSGGRQEPFLYSAATGMVDLGNLGGNVSSGLGINSAGQVVGYSSLQGDLVQHAFVYSGGALLDLNSLIPGGTGWVLNQATAINDSGMIVGNGVNPAGKNHAFLLTPAP